MRNKYQAQETLSSRRCRICGKARPVHLESTFHTNGLKLRLTFGYLCESTTCSSFLSSKAIRSEPFHRHTIHRRSPSPSNGLLDPGMKQREVVVGSLLIMMMLTTDDGFVYGSAIGGDAKANCLSLFLPNTSVSQS